jgi:hypothetical protein
MTTTTTDVRVWGISTYDGVRGKTYKVRWKVDERQFCKTHKSKPPTVKQRVELSKAARRGVPFDIYTGLPITEAQKQVIEATWYDHAVDFMDMKWPMLQPGSRRTLATALATVTAAMTSHQHRRPDQELCIKALLHWSFNRAAREAGDPPVVVRNSATRVDQGCYAAVSYSLISPPRTRFRRIRSAWAGNGITFGSSSGARRLISAPWWLRPAL